MAFNHRIEETLPADAHTYGQIRCQGAKGCDRPPEVFFVCDYVTGKKGRVSQMRKTMCRVCARLALHKAQIQSD